VAAIAQDLQRLLEDARDGALESAATLREELRKNERAVGAMVQYGSLQTVSKNSTSQTYAFGGGTSMTTAEVARAWRDLLNCHDGAQSALIASGIATPSDTQIYTEMMARIEPSFASSLNLENLRCIA